MKTLYVTDMDGTLLDSNARVSERSASIISSLSHDGALITVATARTPATVVPLMKEAYTQPDMVVMTGAALWDREKSRLTHCHIISREDVTPAAEILRRHGITPFFYTVNGGMLEVYHSADTLTRAEQGFVDARLDLPLKRFYLSTALPPASADSVILIFAIGRLPDIEAAAAELRAESACSISAYPDTYSDNTGLIELFAPGVSKARAIRRVAEECGADRIVAFGDNLNDLPMLREADVAVAVDNALPQVKAAADIIIGPNYIDSVALFIEKDFRQQ